jgi:hypothetical protein
MGTANNIYYFFFFLAATRLDLVVGLSKGKDRRGLLWRKMVDHECLIGFSTSVTKKLLLTHIDSFASNKITKEHHGTFASLLHGCRTQPTTPTTE